MRCWNVCPASLRRSWRRGAGPLSGAPAAVLLLDEPFSALDPALRQDAAVPGRRCREQQQLTLLMVSHSVEDAARIAPRSMVVAEGRHCLGWRHRRAVKRPHSSASHLMGSARDDFVQDRQIDRHQRMAEDKC